MDKSGIQEYEGIAEEGKKKGERYKNQMRYMQFNETIIWTALSIIAFEISNREG